MQSRESAGLDGTAARAGTLYSQCVPPAQKSNEPRTFDPLDRLLTAADAALRALLAPARASRPTPEPPAGTPEPELDDTQRADVAGLMRVNHAGEVCAQALYLGQAAVARNAELESQLLAAAAEEQDHLAWCARRLQELDSGPSRLNPLWFAGSWAIGAVAGLTGDSTSLGFVVETERQVEAHLGEHLDLLPPEDARSREVVGTMQEDEARHGRNAQEAGARELPEPVPRLMALASAVMKWAAYRV